MTGNVTCDSQFDKYVDAMSDVSNNFEFVGECFDRKSFMDEIASGKSLNICKRLAKRGNRWKHGYLVHSTNDNVVGVVLT